MTEGSFADFILHHEIIGFHEEPLTLKSGRKSHFYVNWRKASNDAYLLDVLTDFVVAFIEGANLNCETLYGVPEGASKTAVITAFKLAKRSKGFAEGSHTLAMGRAKPKLHGDPKDRLFIGAPQGKTFVLEDTVTTGLSLFQCLDQLLEAGVDVRGVLSLTDRGDIRDDGMTAAQYLDTFYKGKIAYYPLSRAPELLKAAVKKRSPSDALVKALAKELGMSAGELRGDHG
jgi:orotate phosphoribosyltransferase